MSDLINASGLTPQSKLSGHRSIVRKLEKELKRDLSNHKTGNSGAKLTKQELHRYADLAATSLQGGMTPANFFKAMVDLFAGAKSEPIRQIGQQAQKGISQLDVLA